eukprot:scaffold695_cov42-Cyclotella_meneghiniana.AAC.3
MVGWPEMKETSMANLARIPQMQSYRDNPPPPPPRSNPNQKKCSQLCPPPPPPRPPSLASTITATHFSTADSIIHHRRRLLRKSSLETDSTGRGVIFEDDLLGNKYPTTRNPNSRVTFDAHTSIIKHRTIPSLDVKTVRVSAATSTKHARVQKQINHITKSPKNSISHHRLQPKSIHSPSVSQGGGTLNASQSRLRVEFDATHKKEWLSIIEDIRMRKKKGRNVYPLSSSSSMPNILSNNQPKPKSLSSSLTSNLDVSLESLSKDNHHRSDQSISSSNAVDGSSRPRNSTADNVVEISPYGDAEARHPTSISSFDYTETDCHRFVSDYPYPKQHKSHVHHKTLIASSSKKQNPTKNNNMLNSKRLTDEVEVNDMY